MEEDSIPITDHQAMREIVEEEEVMIDDQSRLAMSLHELAEPDWRIV